ncbi:MAG: VPLPA-CTERM sorting domain-containing protein [Pseudomonadota bacterium]
MNFVKTLALAASLALPSSAFALTTPDFLFVESDGFRSNSTGDVTVSADLGQVGPGTIYGIAGRIVGSMDTFTFSTKSAFSLTFVDLADTNGVDLDAGVGFDSTFQPKAGPKLTDFVLTDSNNMSSTVSLISPQGPGTVIFSGVAPGLYTFVIDGTQSKGVASTYDIALTTAAVPLPAALPLLAAGIGGLVALRRRKRA